MTQRVSGGEGLQGDPARAKVAGAGHPGGARRPGVPTGGVMMEKGGGRGSLLGPSESESAWTGSIAALTVMSPDTVWARLALGVRCHAPAQAPSLSI